MVLPYSDLCKKKTGVYCPSWVPSESPPTVHQVWNEFYNLTWFGLRNRLYWGKGKPKGRLHRKRVLGSLLPTVPQRDRQACLAGNMVWVYVPVEEQYPSLFCLFYKASISCLVSGRILRQLDPVWIGGPSCLQGLLGKPAGKVRRMLQAKDTTSPMGSQAWV